MAEISHIFTKEDIKSFLGESKSHKGKKLYYKLIEKRLKLKPNHPQYYNVKLELDDNYTIVFQHNNSEDFPEYSAILIRTGVRVCRLDYHDAHRRTCKKEIFSDRIANQLHLHVYCKDCIQDNLKYDSFILNINEKKLNDLSFECFCFLFCKMIALENDINCTRSLFS